MTEKDFVHMVVEELRVKARAGEPTSSLLRRIQQLAGKTDCKLLSVQCFHKAFGGGVASISPVAGWCGFGGDLTDTQVDAFLASVLDGYRKSSS